MNKKPPVIILEGTASTGKTTLCDNLVKLDEVLKREQSSKGSQQYIR